MAFKHGVSSKIHSSLLSNTFKGKYFPILEFLDANFGNDFSYAEEYFVGVEISFIEGFTCVLELERNHGVHVGFYVYIVNTIC